MKISPNPNIPFSVTRKSLQKLFKNDFTTKIKDFDTSTKIALELDELGKLIVGKGFKKLPKVQ